MDLYFGIYGDLQIDWELLILVDNLYVVFDIFMIMIRFSIFCNFCFFMVFVQI